jgi:Flp pilus assembly protein TadD
MKHTLVLLGLGTIALLTAPGCVQRETTLVGSRADGDAALRDGDYALAAQEYERYLEERPARGEVMYDLGRAYEGMGEMSAAREAYSLAYELDPFNPEYIDATARATAANGEIDAAFDLLEQIARETERSDAYERLGRFLLEFGFPDEAVLAFRTAAGIDPTGSSYMALAQVLAAFEDREGALRALSHALWFAPDSSEAKAMVRSLGQVPGPTFAMPPTP